MRLSTGHCNCVRLRNPVPFDSEEDRSLKIVMLIIQISSHLITTFRQHTSICKINTDNMKTIENRRDSHISFGA